MKTVTIIGAVTRKSQTTLASFGGFDVIIEGPEEMSVSDGYHTMNELYEHRIALYFALCKSLVESGREGEVWRSKRHSDGELCFGTGTQFVLGIGKEKNWQITYHIPIERWDEAGFAETLEKAPEWDGHSSEDVLGRLKQL